MNMWIDQQDKWWKKFLALVMQEGESITFSLEKFQDLLNQMACVGFVVDDQEVVMQLLG